MNVIISYYAHKYYPYVDLFPYYFLTIPVK